MASKFEIFVGWSVNKYWLKKEDWNRNEIIDQSKVIRVEVFSQFKESDNHIWSLSVYVDIQLFSINELKDRISRVNKCTKKYTAYLEKPPLDIRII